jgi:hypothetical protein
MVQNKNVIVWTNLEISLHMIESQYDEKNKVYG